MRFSNVLVLFLGLVGLDQLNSSLGWVGSRKLDARLTLRHILDVKAAP